MKKWISLLAVAALATSASAGNCSFDDFENSIDVAGDGKTNADNQTDLGATFNYYKSSTDMYYQGGYWYAYDDSKDGGNASATPDYITDKEFEGGLDSDGYEGSCLHINVDLGDGIGDEYNTAFYGIGANLKGDGDYFDLSGLSAVSFYAKGDGDMFLKLLTQTSSSFTWGDMGSDFSLSSSWTKVSIAASDLAPELWSPTADAGITWDDCKGAVTKLHFQTYGETQKAGSSVDFYIDNIVLEGVTYEDLTGFPIAVADTKVAVSDVELGDAYPNPFNPVTTINFALPTAEKVSLKVFDAAGNLVKTLYNGVSAGASVNWNATNMNGAKVASGVYFYRLTSASNVVTKKMVLLK